MALSPEFLAELKYKNDIESVISSYVQLKRRGSNLVGLCPFHNEKTPSFTVYPENGSYYCFGCGAGGDVITFVRQTENLDYIEAVRVLAQRSGMTVPEDTVDDETARLKKRVYEMNREAARFFHSYLAGEGGRPMLKYLRDRGLADGTIRSFGLGAAPDTWDSLIKHLKSKGFSENEMVVADLAVKGKRGGCYDKFRGRVMFPIMDLRGNVIAFGGRAMPGSDSNQKYVNTSDTPVFKKSHNLYALWAAKNHGAGKMILAEGYMDVIALHAAGFKNAVAALGTAFTEDQARLLRRYTNEVVLTFDADGAGRKATERAMGILSKTGLPARVLSIPDGKDPDEFIKKNGASRFAALLDGAVSDIEYKLYTAAEGVDTRDDTGRLEYLKRAAAILSRVDDQLTKDLYAGKLADKYGVSKSALLSEAKRLSSIRIRQETQKERQRIVTGEVTGNDEDARQRAKNLRAAKAEDTVISVLIAHPDLYEKVKDRLPAESFVTDLNRAIYTEVLRQLTEGSEFDLSAVPQNFTPKQSGHTVRLMNDRLATANPEQTLEDSIKVVLEERNRPDMDGLNNMSDREWADMIQNIASKKKEG